MITYICHLQVPAQNVSALTGILSDVRDRSLAEEPGVLHYQFARSSDDPRTWVVVEVYRDAEAHAAHMAAPWVVESIPRAASLVEGGFDIKRYVTPEELQNG
jgi:quinol monooxygenase YgiN